MSKQSTSHLFMIEPESFYSNEQTSYTNHYQKEVTDEDIDEITQKALMEFHTLKNNIEEIFNVDIKDHSLYLYATTKKKK